MAEEAANQVATGEDNRLAEAAERRRRYNCAVREARLVTILLSKVDFKVNRQVGHPKYSNKSDATVKYGGKLHEFNYTKQKKVLIARIQWNVEVKSGRRQFAKCIADYDVIYDGFSETDEDILRLFAENIAQAATYAYFRALFANLDWSASLELPPLPVMKFNPKV